ncbi:ubiquitin carboxy-terminal hydrolase (macronuclear) [Tetrahymena thermophila SB210]|uniref:Ubiquitin carboxy-terminal hydrolase n=1 Tax=Tetrahymena thermophila (strain SB210) TaxID=312017 RepID=Q238T3_TETTS|nr:ubiquitin carboxy-terminal hydrolase [Tetrahymena thermophila SB210]EAR93137.2 ubiquitin carboxy-terminal hydrolase [Tetrahymena thermophila SB210]|eukprot:XP_001013382.2 ubiquitin carboxy-terminal hydrolase [Tetrahymena thermophila SB210]
MSYYYNKVNIFKLNQPQIKQEMRQSSNYMSQFQKPTQNLQEYAIKNSEKPQNKVTDTYLSDRQPSFQYRTNNYVISHNNRQKRTPNYQDQKNELYYKYQMQDNCKIANKGQILQYTPNYKNSYENNFNLSNNYQRNFKLDSNKQTKYMIRTSPSFLTLEYNKKNLENSQYIQQQQNSAKSQQQYQNNQINQHLQNENQTNCQTNQKNVATQNIYNLRTITSSSIANRNLNSPQPQYQKSINQNSEQLQNASKFDPNSQIAQQQALNQFIKYRSNSLQNANKIVQEIGFNQFNNQKLNYSFQNYLNEEKINQIFIQKSQQIQNNNQSISKNLDSTSFNSNSAQNNINNKDQTRDSDSQSSSKSLITSYNQFELTSYEKSELSNLKKYQILSQNVKLRAREDSLIKGYQQTIISSSNTNKIQNNDQLKIQENNQKLEKNNANCESQNKIQNTQKSLAETQNNLQQNQVNYISEHLEISIKNHLLQNQQKSNQDNQKQQQLDNESQTQNSTSQQNHLSSRDRRMVERNNQYHFESIYLNKSQYLDKIKIGLPNIGLKCYINSTIQTLRQVYYFDQKIFENPGFSKDFLQLFQCMEERNTKKIQFWIQKIAEKSKQNQEHTYSGDTYMCIYDFLYEIKKSLPDNQKQQFDDLFSRNYKDKLKCGKCERQKIPNTSQFITCLDYQEFGYECSKLDDAFQDNSDLDLFKQINSDDLICPICRDQLQSIRKYKYAPKFMLIRLLSFIPKEQCLYILDKQFEFLVNQKTTQKYEIVGFCSYYGHYYTYTAKYNNKWIEFNDQNSSEVRPDCSKAIYFLLKRI